MEENDTKSNDLKLIESFVFNPGKDNSGISFDNDYELDSPDKNILHGLKVMNIFVGANNSGKSRILRAIFRQRDLMFLPLAEDFLKFSSELRLVINSSRFAAGQLSKTDTFLKECELLASKDFWVLRSVYANGPFPVDSLNASCEEIRNYLRQSPTFFSINQEPLIPDQLIRCLERNSVLIERVNKLPKVSKLYIPTLRGMRTIGDTNSDPYGDRTKKDYFVSVDGVSQKVSSGLGIFEDIKKKLLGGQSDRSFIKAFEEFLTQNFFDNKPITIVPREKDVNGNSNDVVHITFENSEDKERAIFEFGDGIQSIICITYPLFSWLSEHEREESDYLLACIEEPEMYLHPSMQRKLVEVLMDEKFRNIQYFVTTHSNHFLDLFQEPEYQNSISVYGISLSEDGVKKVKKEMELSSSIYDLLGAKPSSLLLADKTIWVEGVTDRVYLRHGIKLYFEKEEILGKKIKKPSEDLHYAFIEYGGSNLAHYIESQDDLNIESICNCKNVFMLVDDDGVVGGSAKFSRYKEIETKIKSFGGIFKKTDGREIENYIKPEVLKGVYPNLSNEITYDDYKELRLPEYLSSNNIKLYISKNNFTDKLLFAEKVISHQNVWEDLSVDMQKLIKNVVVFITPK